MNPTITETRDDELVWQISELPEIKDRVTNDAWSALGDDVRRAHVRLIVGNPDNHVFLVRDDQRVVGCFIIDRKEDGLFEVHTLLARSCRGAQAIRAGRQAIREAFKLPAVQRLVSYCPGNLPQTYFFAIYCGFHLAGIATWRWLKNGISFPVKIVELNRKDAVCH
ncbi:MAG: hypothetical protein KGL39_15600 [Patescibacteria group bacterium]|nr:hypothetical protein [Patescibacteria group bacterium]